MNKKTFIVLSGLIFLGLAPAAFAQEVSPGLTPASPFYFLDTLGERIGLALTFNAQGKAEKALAYAEEKMAELEVLTSAQKEKYSLKLTAKYNEYLGVIEDKVEEMENNGLNVDALTEKLAQNMLRHQERLMVVYGQVSENAKQALEQAMEKSQHGYLRAMEAIESAQIKQQVQNQIREINQNFQPLLNDSQKQRMEEIKNQIKGFVSGGISDEEWETLQADLVELIDLTEEMIKEGLSEEQQTKIISALEEVENAVSSSSIPEVQKQAILTSLGEVKALIQDSLTPTQKIMVIAALEQVKLMIQQMTLEEAEGQIQQIRQEIENRINEGLTEEQDEILAPIRERINNRLNR